MIRKAFILGAGLGLRLRPLTENRPKPTLPILGRPLIEYIFEHLKSVGVEEVVINTHHFPQVYQELFGNGNAVGLKIHYSFEKELLETGGGLKKVEPLLKDGTFIVYNGDILTDGDLAGAIRSHRDRSHLATLILSPDGSNRNVSLDGEGRVTDLRGVLGNQAHLKYAFCGIHILEPEIFQYIPEGRAISIIDIYLELIRQGKKVGGFVWNECFWRDIGDLAAYHQVHQELLGSALKSPFPVHRLGQDGSDRIYYRAGSRSTSWIIMHYGRGKAENTFYHRISIFLRGLGLPIPTLLYADLEDGMLLVEDLGDLSLCKAVESKSKGEVLKLYQQVLQEIVKLHREGVLRYEKDPLPICPSFTQRIYRWESRYFEENLLGEFLHLKLSEKLKARFDRDCSYLAKLLSREKRVLVHRDLQSKNIIIKEGRPFFIDFQGMRFGLPHYDLASLLYDPYVSLDEDVKDYLYRFYLDQAGCGLVGEPEHFERIYRLAALQRLMQALGAYGFLGLKKGKRHFLQYIHPALERLHHVLENVQGLEGLKEVVDKAQCDVVY